MWRRGIIRGRSSAAWGDGLIDQVARDLSAEFPGMKGFSRRNLLYIRKWYEFYGEDGIVQRVAAQMGIATQIMEIPWWHNVLIISKCSDISEAFFYVRKTIENNWSRAVLTMQMESRLYERSGKIINNFDKTLPVPQADLARETLKNPYNFDFLMLGKEAKERDLTRLRCYVVVELKATDFRPEYVGKLNFYLNVVNDKLKHEQDQPSVGILLRKTPNKVIVEYSLKSMLNPLGVAEYRTLSSIPENLRGVCRR